MKKLFFCLLFMSPWLLFSQGAFNLMPNPLASASGTVNIITGSSLNNVFAVGQVSGVSQVIKYDGSSWTTNYTSPGIVLSEMKFLNSTVGYMLGGNGGLFKYNGSSWDLLGQYTTYSDVGLSIISENDVWFCGSYANIVHYNGTTGNLVWSNSPFGVSFRDIIAFSDSDIWLLGNYWDGTNSTTKLYHFDGNSNLVEKMSLPGEDPIEFLSLDANHFMILGYYKAYIYDLTANSYVESHTWGLGNAVSMTMLDSKKVIVGLAGFGIAIYNNNVWSETDEVHGHHIWSPPGDDNNIFLTGMNGQIYLWDGQLSGVSENDQSALAIYPNPTSDKIFLEGNTKEAKLYDLTGKLVAEPYCSNGQTIIDLQLLPQSMYILKAQVDDQLITKKIIKK